MLFMYPPAKMGSRKEVVSVLLLLLQLLLLLPLLEEKKVVLKSVHPDRPLIFLHNNSIP